jgi:uncharacterized protein YkwD
MRASKRVVCWAASLLAFSILTTSSPVVAGSCWTYRDAEKRMAGKINRARNHRGLRRLRLDRHLSRVARVHTNAMIESRQLFHTSNLGRKVTRWNRLGENVGYGGSVTTLHRAFMRSSGHRANILGRFRYIGVATRRAAGRMWTTVVFEHYRDPGTRLWMPRC